MAAGIDIALTLSKTFIPQLKDMTAEDLNTHLSFFIMEVRKQDGSEYPGKTLYLMITGILRHLKENGVDMNFLTNEDLRFNNVR